MNSDTASLNGLFQSAAEDDVIGGEALSALQVVDLGTKIGDAMGASAEDFQVGEMVLVAVLVDDSGSIRFCRNIEPVADGYNCIIEALVESKQQDNIMFHGRLLNGTIICPFVSIDNAVKLQTGPGGNFNPNLGTPLYDEAVAFWGTILAKSQEFADLGVPVRTISLILTDGADEHSVDFYDGNTRLGGRWRAPKTGVKALATDLLRQENHILAAMGVADNKNDPTDFKMVFEAMGIPEDWMLVVDQKDRTKDEFKSEIRRACQVFSQSAVRASQSAGNFSQTAVGGFAG